MQVKNYWRRYHRDAVLLVDRFRTVRRDLFPANRWHFTWVRIANYLLRHIITFTCIFKRRKFTQTLFFTGRKQLASHVSLYILWCVVYQLSNFNEHLHYQERSHRWIHLIYSFISTLTITGTWTPPGFMTNMAISTPQTNLTFLTINIPSSPAYSVFIFQLIRLYKIWRFHH